jgi:alpha-maltose-1-phosphate synthase
MMQPHDSLPAGFADRYESARILGVVEGESSSALSGVAHHLFNALDKRFPVVHRVDYSLRGVPRLAAAAATFRLSRAAWRARFHTSRLAHRMLSRVLAKRLAEVDQEFDLALQVFGWVRGQPHPYALYVDQTRLLAEQGWPAWLPLARRERSELLALEREMYEKAFHVFVMGGSARDSLVADYGVDPSQVTVAGGGVNFEGLPEPGSPSQDPTILFVGREFERKGGDTLIAAFAMVREQLPDARLHIVGVADRLRMPGVMFHGKVSDRRRLGQLYRKARVFSLPSRYEPFGLALTEAMAHGVACVGTNVQSIPEILAEGRAGLLVPPGEPEPLADALLRLLTDEELARTIGSAGRRWVEQNFTWARVVERMAPVLSQARRAAP